MQELVPDIDSNIPLPASVTEAMPELSPKEELEMRARTIKLISDLSGKPVEPGQEHKDQAKDLVQTLVAQPQNAMNLDRKSTRLNSSHSQQSRMPSSA